MKIVNSDTVSVKTMKIDKYVVESVIAARFQQASVLTGIDTESNKKVVVKLLGSNPIDSEEETFEREVFALQHIPYHPNVVGLYDLVNAPSAIILPFLGDDSLENIIDTKGKLPISECKRISQGVLRGLSHIHSHGIVHRDMKPGNIMITPEPVIIDFGASYHIAIDYLDELGMIIGTPTYTSPEMAMSEAIDKSTQDIYSLGITLFEMLTGDVPFKSASSFEALRKHIVSSVPSPTDIDSSIPVEFSDIVLRATAKEPADRYQSAGEMYHEISKVPKRRKPAFAMNAVRLPRQF